MEACDRIAVVLKGYPRLSETFIAQEIHGLEKRGLSMDIFSLRWPTDKKTHPVHDEINAPVTYLPEYLHQEFSRVRSAWSQARRLPGYHRALKKFLNDFRRDRTRNRVRRFGQACVLANEIDPQVQHIYAHFLHTPASVARYAAIMRDLPFSLSAHAVDIWTSPDWEISEKMHDAQWTTVCSDSGAQRLKAIASAPNRIRHLYHGLDLNRFPAFDNTRAPRKGDCENDPVRLLSVGRAVPKKGFDILMQALANIPKNLHWRWTHIGAGEQLVTLKRLSETLGLSGTIEWRGAQPQKQVFAAMREADIFVLPCQRDSTGNQDGLPNVLMEAQSQRLPVVSTDFAGIPELVIHNETGLLAEPGDPLGLRDALVSLITSPTSRDAFALAGETRVRRHFNSEAWLDQLAGQFSKNLIARAA
jgi:glycosyltransferase involved in cell wall biosynthesis